jgi:hypothetical protein
MEAHIHAAKKYRLTSVAALGGGTRIAGATMWDRVNLVVNLADSDDGPHARKHSLVGS